MLLARMIHHGVERDPQIVENASARGSLPARCLLGLLGLLVVLGSSSCGGDSTTPEKPACEVDADCAGTPATPYCSAALVCVACEDSSQCSGATPVCEQASHTCQACSADSECASGVCLETQGTCATPAQLIYVKEAGGVDNAVCDEKAPCKTLVSAKTQITAQRNVIRVIGAMTKEVELQTKVTIDGDGSTWTGAIPLIGVSTANADVTIEGFTLQGADNSPVVSCLNTGLLRLHQTTVRGGTQSGIFSSCRLAVSKTKIINNANNGVTCTNNGTVTIEDSEIADNTGRAISTATCAVRLARNRISGNPGPNFLVDLVDPGKLEVENNLIWDKVAITSSGLSITNAPTGGLVRFNTVVNSATGTHTGEGVRCMGSAVVTSNVIAWQNGLAQAATACARRYNAFDSSTSVGMGEGNTAASLTALFVNPASDFHLAAGSPAHALAEQGVTVPVDLEGKPRAASGRLDAGAFETP